MTVRRRSSIPGGPMMVSSLLRDVSSEYSSSKKGRPKKWSPWKWLMKMASISSSATLHRLRCGNATGEASNR